MSHHFDTPTAKEDPRINVCDFYLFRGRPGTTVMALTVNPNAGVGAPDTFRDEGLYAFRFDTNRDLREDVACKGQFGAPAHADGGEHRHVQTFTVRRATRGATIVIFKLLGTLGSRNFLGQFWVENAEVGNTRMLLPCNRSDLQPLSADSSSY
jgi:hypothetical protein